MKKLSLIYYKNSYIIVVMYNRNKGDDLVVSHSNTSGQFTEKSSKTPCGGCWISFIRELTVQPPEC